MQAATSRAQLRPISFLSSTPNAFETIFNQRHSSLRLAVDTGLINARRFAIGGGSAGRRMIQIPGQSSPFCAESLWTRKLLAGPPAAAALNGARAAFAFRHESQRWARSLPAWPGSAHSISPHPMRARDPLSNNVAQRWPCPAQVVKLWIRERRELTQKRRCCFAQVLTRMTHTECVTKCASDAVSINLCEPAYLLRFQVLIDSSTWSSRKLRSHRFDFDV